MVAVLERIEQTDKPRRLGCRQDVPLNQDVLDLREGKRDQSLSISLLPDTATYLIHLGQRRLLHLFQRADLPRIGLACEVDTTVPALPDLRDDAELLDAQLGAPPAEHDTLAARVRGELLRVGVLGDLREERVRNGLKWRVREDER